MEKILNKYIAMLVGALMLSVSFSSCTDQDEIEISYETSAGITAAHLFDAYSPFQSGDFDLSRDNWILNIDFLVYDAAGKLSGREHFETSNIKEVFTPTLSLSPGKYKAISIASFTKNDNGEEFVYWIIDNIDDLVSLSITENTSYFPVVFETLGIDTQEITVEDKPLSINVDIRPVTSLVTVFMDDKQYLHYGMDGKYSAKCRKVAQYNIKSLSSNSCVRFGLDGSLEYVTKEQLSEYNTAISRPHDKMSEKTAPIGICYRAFLPEENKQFQWKIYNYDLEGELKDVVNYIVGDYPTEGKSNNTLKLGAGKQYALMMLLDATQLLFEETGKDSFNYDDYAKAYMKEYELGLIDAMLDFGYDQMLGWRESQYDTYLRKKPYEYSDDGTVAYYPHSDADHFEQFMIVRYTDATRKTSNRVMLNLSLPLTITGTVIEQPLSQEIIDALVEKLNSRYTKYKQIGDIYQWIDGENPQVSTCGIALDVSKPGNANLFYDLIKQPEAPKEDPTDYSSLIFPYEWETFMGQSGEAVTSVLGSNYEFDTDTWVYSNYNPMISFLSVAKFYSETINSVMIMLNNPTEEVDKVVIDHLKSKFIDIGAGRYADSESILTRKLVVSYQNGMISYNAY